METSFAAAVAMSGMLAPKAGYGNPRESADIHDVLRVGPPLCTRPSRLAFVTTDQLGQPKQGRGFVESELVNVSDAGRRSQGLCGVGLFAAP